MLRTTYTRNQFNLCYSNRFLTPSAIPDNSGSQTVMRNSSLGRIEGSFCRCSNCKTNRCALKSPIALVALSIMLESSVSIDSSSRL